MGRRSVKDECDKYTRSRAAPIETTKRLDCGDGGGVAGASQGFQDGGGGLGGLFAEEENGSPGNDAIVVTEFDGLNALAVHRSAVLGFEVIQYIRISIAGNTEMTAGKGFVADLNVGGFVAANGKRLLANFPAFRRPAVLTQ
jgi:hypothetical protein